MEVMSESKKMPEKSFSQSQITINNRTLTNISGVERVYETNENKIQLKVMGSNLQINGEGLNISKIDVEAGIVIIEGKIIELRYFEKQEKKNFLKKLFK